MSVVPKIKKIKIKNEEKEKIKNRYFEAVGRRKTSVARTRLFSPANGAVNDSAEAGIEINGKPAEKYFFTPDLLKIATASLRKFKLSNKFFITAKIKGGGIHSQAEAFKHATARALIKFNPEFRKKLKRAGYLTRDPRAKERRKFGLKKARKAPQWSKR